MASRQLNARLAMSSGVHSTLRAAPSTAYRPSVLHSRLARFSTSRMVSDPPRWLLKGIPQRQVDAILKQHGLPRPERPKYQKLPHTVQTRTHEAEHEESKPKGKRILTSAFRIPDYSTSQPIKLAHAEVHGQFSPFSLKDSLSHKTLADGLTRLFTKPAPDIHFSSSDFYALRKNTRVPEVCIIGRSNVGKSSLVNAVAGRSKSDLARVSKKAGHTRAINVYGFGPAPRPEKGEVELSDDFKGKEEMPTHQFFLADMPGYGFASREEWGKQIELYLRKRRALKGAVMLIDAEVGPKRHDWEAIEMIAYAGIHVAFVLTKADKVKGGDAALLETCRNVWKGIIRMEARLASKSKAWTWDKELYVTALGATDVDTRTETTASARLAIAKLAGLVKDTRPEAVKDPKWSGKIVSFDEIFGGGENKTGEAATDGQDEWEDEPLIEQHLNEGSEDAMSIEDIMALQDQQEWMEPSASLSFSQKPAIFSRKQMKERARNERRDVDTWKDNKIKSTHKGAKVRAGDKHARPRAGSIFARGKEERRQETIERMITGAPDPRLSGMRNSKNPPPTLAPTRMAPLPNFRSRTPVPPIRPRLHPSTALEALEAASAPRFSGTNKSNRQPASFLHTTARAHVREQRTQPYPLSKEELGNVLQEFIQTLRPKPTPQDQSRQRKLDMEDGIGQPEPEKMKALWTKRLQDNKERLARRFKNQSAKVPGIIEARLKQEGEKLAKQASATAKEELDWRAEQRRLLEKRLKGEEFDEDEDHHDVRDVGELADDQHGSDRLAVREDGLRQGFRFKEINPPGNRKLTKKEKKALKAGKKGQSESEHEPERETEAAFEDAFKSKIGPLKNNSKNKIRSASF